MPYTSFPSVPRSSLRKLHVALLYYHVKMIKSSSVTKNLQKKQCVFVNLRRLYPPQHVRQHPAPNIRVYKSSFHKTVIETTEMSQINQAADKDVLFKTPLSAAFLCKNDYGCIIKSLYLYSD